MKMFCPDPTDPSYVAYAKRQARAIEQAADYACVSLRLKITVRATGEKCTRRVVTVTKRATGETYTCADDHTCTCADYTRRGGCCKHLFMAYAHLKGLKAHRTEAAAKAAAAAQFARDWPEH